MDNCFYFNGDSKENNDTKNISYYGLDDLNNFNYDYYNFWEEVLINTSINWPKNIPPILNIDSLTAKINIANFKIVKTPALSSCNGTVQITNLENKISTGCMLFIDGFITFTFTYIGANCDNKLCYYTHNHPFSTIITLPTSINNVYLINSCNIDFNIVSCIDKICVISFTQSCVSLYLSASLQAVPHFKNYNSTKSNYKQFQSDCLMEYIDIPCHGVNSCTNIDFKVGNKYTSLWTQFVIPEILIPPLTKPTIKEVISMSVSIDILFQTMSQSPLINCSNFEGSYDTGKKLIVHFILHQKLNYLSSDSPNNDTIYSINFDSPHTTFIMVPNSCTLSDCCTVIPCILDVSLYKITNTLYYKSSFLFFKANLLRGLKI